MGGTSTKDSQANDEDSPPSGKHSPFPIDHPPYTGPELLYCFVHIEAPYRIRQEIDLGPGIVTTDIQDYYKDISDCFKEGYLMRQFIKPPAIASIDVRQLGDTQLFQAILTKSIPGDPSSEEWALQIRKCWLNPFLLKRNDLHQQDLMTSVEELSHCGGRFVCMETTGVRSGPIPQELRKTEQEIYEIDVFFNVPKHSKPIMYTYKAEMLAITYDVLPPGQPLQWGTSLEWIEYLEAFLNVGWKLIDIFVDASSLTKAMKHSMQACSKVVDTIWFFEKERARIDDDRPVYEATIIEYVHKIKVHGPVQQHKSDWRAVIAGMGRMGWELASIVQTPEITQTTLHMYSMKMLLFFQRRLIYSSESFTFGKTKHPVVLRPWDSNTTKSVGKDTPPPSYTEVVYSSTDRTKGGCFPVT